MPTTGALAPGASGWALPVAVLAASVVGPALLVLWASRTARARRRHAEALARRAVAAAVSGDRAVLAALRAGRAAVPAPVLSEAAVRIAGATTGASSARAADLAVSLGVVERARAALHHRRAHQRVHALRALAAVRHPAAPPAARLLLQGEHARGRVVAAEVLASTGAPGDLLRVLGAVARGALPAAVARPLLAGSAGADALLLRVLDAASPEVRRVAAATLGDRRHLGALEPLLARAAVEVHPGALVAVLGALARLGSPRGLPAAARHLSPRGPVAVRHAAAAAVAELGGRGAASSLEDALLDPDPHVRARARRGLAALAGTAPGRLAPA